MTLISPFTPPKLNEPHRWRGKRIGLLGGSFNPPHHGHLHIARLARRKLDLDFIWWIITPQNPLKGRKDMAPYETRYEAVADMLTPYPRQMPSHIEHELGTNFTYETVTDIRTHFPQTDFVWICGMDNAHIFHKWDRWQDLLAVIPIVFIARPPAHSLIRQSPVRLYSAVQQNFISKGGRLDLKTPSINWMMSTKMIDISSTNLRKNKDL